ncbi:MATH and LRR domain-containing protein PFE0570w isoform X1 [Hydra vulgaris]|uniref:MATH and LRR domain-containing protein PFE0570w isoform X1 n=1 Tax=Hydra vulgaris TaxID=6087 RepID=UPI00019265B6|nr:MATH and LRR domain-containing protein PFE0570w-like [Hydra vulgaris]
MKLIFSTLAFILLVATCIQANYRFQNNEYQNGIDDPIDSNVLIERGYNQQPPTRYYEKEKNLPRFVNYQNSYDFIRNFKGARRELNNPYNWNHPYESKRELIRNNNFIKIEDPQKYALQKKNINYPERNLFVSQENYDGKTGISYNNGIDDDHNIDNSLMDINYNSQKKILDRNFLVKKNLLEEEFAFDNEDMSNKLKREKENPVPQNFDYQKVNFVNGEENAQNQDNGEKKEKPFEKDLASNKLTKESLTTLKLSEKKEENSKLAENDSEPSKLVENNPKSSTVAEKDLTAGKLDKNDLPTSKLSEKDTAPNKLAEIDLLNGKLDSPLQKGSENNQSEIITKESIVNQIPENQETSSTVKNVDQLKDIIFQDFIKAVMNRADEIVKPVVTDNLIDKVRDYVRIKSKEDNGEKKNVLSTNDFLNGENNIIVPKNELVDEEKKKEIIKNEEEKNELPNNDLLKNKDKSVQNQENSFKSEKNDFKKTSNKFENLFYDSPKKFYPDRVSDTEEIETQRNNDELEIGTEFEPYTPKKKVLNDLYMRSNGRDEMKREESDVVQQQFMGVPRYRQKNFFRGF